MYNHARTLLLNLPGSDTVDATYPGEELIPAEYVPVTLPSYLKAIRFQLFGAEPDRVMLNYRSYQLLTLIESTELQSHILALDPRITYTKTGSAFLDSSLFEPKVTQYRGNRTLSLLGSPTSPDSSGKVFYSYDVQYDSTLRIKRSTPPVMETENTPAITAGLTEAFDLMTSGYKIRLSTGTDSAWTIRGYLQPTRSLSSIATSLESIGEPFLLSLFGSNLVEPYTTFFNCWKTHPDFAYRLSGILLAMIYRTEELRNA